MLGMKTTKAHKKEIVALYEAGLKQHEIASRFGVTRQYVSELCRKQGVKRIVPFRRINANGYVELYLPEHPFKTGSSRVLEHRAVYVDTYGVDDKPCHWCGTTLSWGTTLFVDHLNEKRDDNSPANLVPACVACNLLRNKAKHKAAIRKKAGRFLSFNGQTRCITEWAETLGISRSVLAMRVYNGWSTEDALNTPVAVYKPYKNKKSIL
jgi:transcriptional regulator with XRE-family HTH domain